MARPKDSGDIPSFKSFWTSEEIKDFMNFLKKRARKSDKIAVFVAEHLHGKAVQPIEGGDRPLEININVKDILKKAYGG